MDVYETRAIGALIEGNSYVGRGIVIGKTMDASRAAVAYFIMGRSENSRNRIFKEVGEDLEIDPFEIEKVEDPSLIIYFPIRKVENNLIVTNGDQTDTIRDFITAGKTFAQALDTREFEPDAPNYTPRISGMLTFSGGDFTYQMSILKSADREGTACSRYTFSYPALAGTGHFLHTYLCDGNPIPTFCGEPERVAIPNDIDTFTRDLWEHLDDRNKISLYVRYIDLETGAAENRMINRNRK